MNKLQSYLPPSVMLPPSRLNELLNQALELQALRCSHHNTSQGVALNNSSLLVDHCCPKSLFPMYTTQVSYFFLYKMTRKNRKVPLLLDYYKINIFLLYPFKIYIYSLANFLQP